MPELQSLRPGDVVLVTGASGFIGSRLCKRLSEIGVHVHAVSRRNAPGQRDGIRWWRGDVADPASLESLYSRVRPDVVFHLAAHVLGGRELDLVRPTFHCNLASTVELLTIATDSGCRRFVLPGSLEEPEGDSPVPSSPYAASKWASTAYARMFGALYGLPVVIPRVFMVYGPGRQDERKLIPYLMRSLLSDESPRLSSGSRAIDWIYIDDAVEGLIASAGRGVPADCRVDIGSGELTTIRELAEMLVRLLGSPVELRFGDMPERPMEQVRRADVERARRVLGWSPTITMEDGLLRTFRWYSRRLAPDST